MENVNHSGPLSGGRTGNSIIECLLGEMASLIRRVENLVVEDGEVEGEAKTDGVRRRQLGLSNLSGGLVGIERLVGRRLTTVANRKLGKVTVIVALPVKRSVVKMQNNTGIRR